MAQVHPPKLIVIAHRGDHTSAPENTLKAFQDAIDAGVDYVEVDLRATRDGELVVMHDATIDRMTTARGKVEEMDWSALRQLYVLNKEQPAFGEHNIPTFEEVLKVCKGKVGIYLDFKDGDISKTWTLILKHHMEKNVVVYINQADDLEAWRRQATAVPQMVSLPDSVKSFDSYVRFQHKAKAEIIDGSYKDYTPELVHAINRNGQSIWVDVQGRDENEALWEKVLALGVQGMQTDHPRELLRWRNKHK